MRREHLHLVLVGGGHSHLEVLRRFAREPPACRLTLIAREPRSAYTGMLPGVVAGRYRRDEAEIALAPLARAAGARLVIDAVTGLDPRAQVLSCARGGPIGYDLLSLDTGAVAGTAVPGVAEHAVAVRPVGRFLDRWAALCEGEARPRIAVIGAGLGGIELALAVAASRAAAGVALLAAGEIGPGLPVRARRALCRALDAAGVTVRRHASVTAVTAEGVVTAAGEALGFDAVLWTAGAAPAAWLAASGLATDAAGFVAVGPGLASLSHGTVFASGDAAAVIGQPRPKAGVFAVRQGPPLACNLRRALAGKPPLPMRLQRRWLSLVALGDDRALAIRGGWSFEGALPWLAKDWIDRRWIARYKSLAPPDGAGRSGQ